MEEIIEVEWKIIKVSGWAQFKPHYLLNLFSLGLLASYIFFGNFMKIAYGWLLYQIYF